MSESPDDVPADGPTLVPQPRDIRWGHGELPAGRLEIRRLPDQLARYRAHVERLLGGIGAGSGPPTPVTVDDTGLGQPEAYQLRVAADGVWIGAGDPLGVLHAARTLVDIDDAMASATAAAPADAAASPGRLPFVEISDHPTFRTRGVFTESFAGTDLMDLADWQAFIDRLGQLKITTVGVSVYGCWDIRHDGDRSEYLFLPLEDFPQLRTPQRMVTWDPDTGQETVSEYLPRFCTDDLLGDLTRYADAQGIGLIPHWGGPGHSTLIPRLVPELSALDDDGAPTGYGYCVSRPEARATLSALFANIARQHMVPHGIRRLHVAGDEYYPIRNVDPDDRLRVVSPYCRCAQCRELSPGEQLVEYLVTAGRVLAEYDVSMVHWHDTLVREGVLDRYRERAAREGFPQPVVSWWKYNDPVPVPDASGGETWVSPTTGLFATLFGQDFSPNIETALRRGASAGAVGTLAYTMHNPADHASYACLADLAWNLEGSGGATGFRRRWATYLSPDDPDAACHALSLASTVTGSYPLMMYLVQHILPYFSTAAAGVTTYPDDIIRAVSLTQPPLADALRQVRDTLLDAVALMPPGPGRRVRRWGPPVETWRAQVQRLADSITLVLGVLEAARTEPTEAVVAELERQGAEVMRRIAGATPSYLQPAVLREHWGFVREIRPALERLRAHGGPSAAESWHAWIV